MTLVVRRWSLKCGRVLDQGSRRATHLLRLPRRAPGNIAQPFTYRAVDGKNSPPVCLIEDDHI
jgi:hypothetical protein